MKKEENSTSRTLYGGKKVRKRGGESRSPQTAKAHIRSPHGWTFPVRMQEVKEVKENEKLRKAKSPSDPNTPTTPWNKETKKKKKKKQKF